MPFTRRRRFRARRRPYTRRVARVPGAPLGRVPRWGHRMRVGQNLTRNVFWFKTTGPIEVDPATGRIFQRFAPTGVVLSPAFMNFARSYEQYKVLKVIVRFFPASVGSEGINPEHFHRGNVCTYIDQPPISATPPTAIDEVMNLPSCRIQQPRRFTSRYMNRPRGGRTNVWPLIDHVAPGGAPAVNDDTWISQVNLFGDNFAPGPLPGGVTMPPYYFYEVLYKVVFRGRYTQ